MILGNAAGLPVVACVATKDRWNHLLECPYCGETHTHGGHGPTSPAGAINDARYSPCDFGGEEGSYYVLFEVPGRTSMARSEDRLRILRKVIYEIDRMPDLDELLAEFTTYYEQVWTGLHRPGAYAMGHNYPPFISGQTRWGYAYRGAGPTRPGAALFRAPRRPPGHAAEQRRLRAFLEKEAPGNWLAKSILEDPQFPAEVFGYDDIASHLGAFAEPEDWQEELDDLWDAFREGEVSRQRIEIKSGVHLLIDSWRNYCTVLVDRDGLGGFPPELPAVVKEVLKRFEGPTREMFKRLGHRSSWMHLSGSNWYNLHVPIRYRDVAVNAMRKVEVDGEAADLEALLVQMEMAFPVAGEPAPTEWPTAIYQWFDGDGVPIYYGVTKDMHSRQTTHARRGSWGYFSASCQVARADTLPDALAMERDLIERDRPIFNRQYNNSPEARARLAAYLTKHGRLDLLS